MKKLLIYVAAIALLGGLALWFITQKEKSNEKKDNREYVTLLLQVHTEEAPDVDPEIIMEQSAKCLEMRLDRIIPYNFTIEVQDTNKIKINIVAKEYSDQALASRINNLLRTGDLQFRTTLPSYEVWNALYEAETKDTINEASIADYLNVANEGNACLGYAHHSDTAEINQMFRNLEAQNLLTGIKVKPMWSAKPRNGKHELVAIFDNGVPELKGDVVEKARVEFDQVGNAWVSLEMNKKGARKWADLTWRNIGKQIAIILDGLVHSYPMVNQGIDGGVSSITGNFTIEEAKDLANVLDIGKLPVKVSIIDITH